MRKIDEVWDSAVNMETVRVDCWCCLRGFWKVEESTLAAWEKNAEVSIASSTADVVDTSEA